jgi:hypothetical protein
MTRGAWFRQRPITCLEGGPNAGDSPAPGPAVGAWHRGPSDRRRGGPRDASGPRPTPERAGQRQARRGEDPSLPFNPPETNFSRRPSPPGAVWGRRPPRGGQDARPIRSRGPWHSHRPPAARMTRVFERRAGCSGTPGHRQAGRGVRAPASVATPRSPPGHKLRDYRTSIIRDLTPISAAGKIINPFGVKRLNSSGI